MDVVVVREKPVSEEITQRVFPRRSTPLIELAPAWLDDGTRDEGLRVAGTRFGMGVSFRCPGHLSADHRIELYFLNPMDGYAPKPLPTLYYRTGQCFEDLTLSAGISVVREGRPVHEILSVEGHWDGYVHGGMVIDALRFGW